MPDKTFAELEAQAQAMVDALTAQRNAAQDQNAMLMGHIAILEMRLKASPESSPPAECAATTEISERERKAMGPGVEQSG